MFLHITPFLNTKHRSRTVVLNNLRVSQRNFFIVKKKKKTLPDNVPVLVELCLNSSRFGEIDAGASFREACLCFVPRTGSWMTSDGFQMRGQLLQS